MSFRAKLGAILFLVALTPVLVIGFLSYRASGEELTKVVQKAQEDRAEDLARFTEATVLHAVESLTLTIQALPLDSFSAAELSDVLRIPLRQVGGLTAVALIGADAVAVVPPVSEAALKREPPDLEGMAAHVPLAAALSLGAAVGPPYRVASGAPRVVIAVSQGPRVVSGELSLLPVVARLAELEAQGARAVLVDASGAPVAGTLSWSEAELSLIKGHVVASGTIERADGEVALAAYAPAGTLGWGVLTARPRSVALAASNRVRSYTIFWALVALVLAGTLSFWLARGISRPIADLSFAARALSEGRYDAELPVLEGSGELAAFGATFRTMAGEIRRRGEEIGAWNLQLQQRVDQRTAELAAAQDQILRTRRLAALGSLGAGVAHELNNPLTGVLVLLALVQMNVGAESEDGVMLETALEQARRMSKIIERLRSLSEAERAVGGQILDLSRPIKTALQRSTQRLEAQQIVHTLRVDPGVPTIQGDEEQLLELVAQLIDNAAQAMPGGGQLDLHVSAVEGRAVKLTVSDTGRGIPPEHRERIFDPFFTTKDGASTGVGLGLSTCSQIVERHHGRLSVQSEVGRGSTFVVLLPASSDKPHLD